MIDNTNSQESAFSTRVMGEGMQAETQQVSREISHVAAEMVNMAKTALHFVHERLTAEQPAGIQV